MLKWLLAKATSHVSYKVQTPGASPPARRAVPGLEPQQARVNPAFSTSTPLSLQGFSNNTTVGSLAQTSHSVPMAPFSELETPNPQSRTQQKSN